MRLSCISFIFFIVSLTAFTQQAANQFRRIDIDRGLSNNQVNTIFADSHGYIWIATVSGLNRYDGYNFTVFKNNPENPASLPENNIHDIFEDHLGNLWLSSSTGLFYIYDPLTESFGTDHILFLKDSPLPRNYFSTIRKDSNKGLWFSNNQLGLYYYSTKDDKIVRLFHNPNDLSTLSSNQIVDVGFCSKNLIYAVNQRGIIDVIDPITLKVIRRIAFNEHIRQPEISIQFRLFIDSDDDLWLYSKNTSEGVFYINQQTGAIRLFSAGTRQSRLSSNNISGLVEEKKGIIWIGTDHGGINIIHKIDYSVEVLTHVRGDITSLSSNSIYCLHKSEDDIIWIGTFKNGVNYYHEQLFQFKLYRSQPFQERDFFSNDVNCFAEDKQGNLWIGTNGDGLVYYNRVKNTFRTYRHDPANPASLSNDVIVSLFLDNKDRLWIGTYQGGLNCYNGRTFKRYLHDPADPSSLADDRVWQIHQDRDNRLWIGTLGGGLDLYDERTDGFVHHRSGDFNSVGSNFILALHEDSSGNLWIGTSNGLNMRDATTNRFRHYFHEEGNSSSLSNNTVLSVLEDMHGRLWVGTRKGLNLLDRQNNTFTILDEQDGLPDHNIISLQQDDLGNLWIATLNGLSNLIADQQRGDFIFRNFDVLDGLQGREFNEHSSLRTSGGELIFGGANGFNIFHPSEIVVYDKAYRVIITDFKLFNRSIGIGEHVQGKVLLEKAINFSQKIYLKHNQNVFSISFSALNYYSPERTRFRYKLEGFSDDWLEADSQTRTATFTNLNPGKYTFRVMAQASDGSWNTREAKLQIEVIPPFYNTLWAYLLYALVLIVLGYQLVLMIRNKETQKFKRRQEAIEYHRIRELDAMKTRFFTNVSHEFRTPLTLIITPLEKLMKEVNDPALNQQLSLMHRNGKRLLSLVNQLLDFRKLEVNKISFNPSYGDIACLIKDAFNSFNDLFESKNISYEFHSGVEQYLASFDHDKMEKIVFNLLSNAVKFTPENGRITLHINSHEPGSESFKDLFTGKEYFEIVVKDTGIGIAPDRQSKIFDRFFQSDDNLAVINQGSGIGLALTLEFVKMHGGTIEVESQPGAGSAFKVCMPLAITESIAEIGLEKVLVPKPTQETDASRELALSQSNKPVVLIIEDNEDLRFYLRENLKQSYKILEASNGEAGWEKINTHMPHLVVSDIMMPVLNGIELCKRIKNDPRTSHIPVILLTARISSNQKVEGLEAGAEDYITKPFNYKILELKIKGLIELRLSFQKAFSGKFEIKPGEIGITSLDEKFLQKALKVAEENIGNSEFSVEKMGRELGVSRGHLYNKLMALTGKTPVEFIRIMRLKRAAQLLGKSQLTVSEVAFQVGFNDPKYFSKYFRDEFGMLPSEYARKNA